MPKYLVDLVCKLLERLPGDLDSEIKTIAAAALTADEPATVVLIIPSKAILAIAYRARPMPVDEVAGIHP